MTEKGEAGKRGGAGGPTVVRDEARSAGVRFTILTATVRRSGVGSRSGSRTPLSMSAARPGTVAKGGHR